MTETRFTPERRLPLRRTSGSPAAITEEVEGGSTLHGRSKPHQRPVEEAASGSLSRPGRRGLTAAPGEPFVAIVGIDRFRGVRDDLGETEANAALEILCQRIQTCAASVHLGRINRSSIEFTFYAANFDRAEQAAVTLQQRLEAPIVLSDRNLTLDIAIGLAGRREAGEDLEALVDRAEHALAKARARHAKTGAFTEQDRLERRERLALMRELRSAIARDELTVFYQPKLCLRTSRIVSMEALIRWPHGERGFVPPDTFIPLAEDTGEIGAITDLVLARAMADAEALADAGHAVRIDLNVSGGLIADTGFAASALEALKGREDRFGFEITETAVIANPERALSHIRAFSAAGIAIAIDDYGSGLSSLSYLKQIPADELKIDKSFVSGLTTSHRDPLLVRSTIDLAHALGMAVTAEGVDNPLSLALLKAMGCDMAQGYQISKPLPYEPLCGFLEKFRYSDVAPPIRAAR